MSAALNVTVDTVAPAAPAITGFADDTGVAGDGITADTTPTLAGTAETNSTMQVLRDGAAVGSVTASASGAWSFPSAALTDGTYAFSARAVDLGGNTGAASAALTVTVTSAATRPRHARPGRRQRQRGVVHRQRHGRQHPDRHGHGRNGRNRADPDGATMVGSGVADAAGVYTVTTSALADGVHALSPRGGGGPMGGAEARVNTFTAGDQTSPSVAVLAGGGYVVTWESTAQDGSGAGVCAQRYTAAGAAEGAEFRFNTFSAGDQRGSSTTALAGGGFVTVWQSAAQP